MKHLIFILFILNVNDGFNFNTFLAIAKNKGVKLYAAAENDSPHGEAYYYPALKQLHVRLHDSAIPVKVAAKVKDSTPGRAVLPGDLSSYKATIESFIEASQ